MDRCAAGRGRRRHRLPTGAGTTHPLGDPVRPGSRPAMIALLGAAMLLACSSRKDGTTGGAADSSGVDSMGTPVQMARVERRNLRTIVTGPGRTTALIEERVRAPFVGTLTSLTVAVGDRVAAGQEIGTIVAQNSEAALRGAQAMLQSARTPAER